MYALVDCNSCYASCEQIFRPDLRGKPVVVLSNNDGCIVACSKEAKALGIPMYQPFFKIKPILKQHKVAIFSSNYTLYGDISHRVMQLLEMFCDDLEIYSIDEAFLDLAPFNALEQHGQAIRLACWQQQRMPVSVGIGSTKTLAKLANQIAKKSKKLNGVCVIENSRDWQPVYQKIPVAKIWGIGNNTALKLARWNVHTVADFYQQPAKRLRKHFGVNVERTLRELHGEVCLTLETQQQPRQMIYCGRSFQNKVNCHTLLRERLAQFAVRCAEKLRQRQQLCQGVMVNLNTAKHQPNYKKASDFFPLPFATNDSRHLVGAAGSLLHKLYQPGLCYAKAGVGLVELTEQRFQQTDFTQPQQSAHSQQLMQTLDTINQRYGSGTLHLAAQGKQHNALTTRAYHSPYYTTRFSDIPTINMV